MNKETLTCKDVIDFLGDYLDGGLTDDSCEEFERHLAECPDCSAYPGTYKLTIELSKGASDRPAEEAFDPRLIEAVLAACRE